MRETNKNNKLHNKERKCQESRPNFRAASRVLYWLFHSEKLHLGVIGAANGSHSRLCHTRVKPGRALAAPHGSLDTNSGRGDHRSSNSPKANEEFYEFSLNRCCTLNNVFEAARPCFESLVCETHTSPYLARPAVSGTLS